MSNTPAIHIIIRNDILYDIARLYEENCDVNCTWCKGGGGGGVPFPNYNFAFHLIIFWEFILGVVLGKWTNAYAAVNGNLDPTLSKGRQAFGVNSTSHLHLQKIEVGWIFTLFIFGRTWICTVPLCGYGESLPNHANCIMQCVNLRLKT